MLNETGSAALFGMVSALAIIPMIVLSPVGQAIYGNLFQLAKGNASLLFFAAAAITILMGVLLRSAFWQLDKIIPSN